jgi:hypothetical protein
MNSNEKIQHNGQAPARRPPEDEPERIGEGELGDGPSAGEINPNDEYYAEKGKPLEPGSKEAQRGRATTKGI